MCVLLAHEDQESPPILDLDEANGNLLTDDATRNVSPQRGTPQSDNRFPNTLLGCRSKRERYYVQDLNEYFFDRHRST
ncbi:unnamed protein product [Heligmosomoides polygyrus]|uniref:Uncharacterized protein n=1 Tax=Heligmosomoides polygyrus TaxID=6339 RepID=A0A183GBU7_HELPZ|nr:unnamed protein product [Heligmosomoides polygyrus]